MSQPPPSPPPGLDTPPPLGPGAPPVLIPNAAPTPGPLAQVLVLLLSVCLGVFLADALFSLVDDSLILFAGIRVLTAARGLVFVLAMLVSVVVYGLMGLTPMVPKRVFLPLTLFNPAVMLLMLPLMIFFYRRSQQIAWAISVCQVVVAVGVLCWMQGGLRLRWPLVPAARLRPRRFSWPNLLGFLLVNALVVIPAVVVYVAVCASVAVNHFSEGFLKLGPGGFTVEERKYVRGDGKTIHLVPMAHIGEAGFYRRLSGSFPTNALVLMEGVTDNSELLTNKITYKRMANSLGLAEQQQEFHPVEAAMVMADVDVEEFGTNTIGFLNLMMLVHSRGLTPENVLKVLRFSPPPGFEEDLFDDLLKKRNRHLIRELHARLAESDTFVVPWGVAHMPGIAESVQADGFRLAETRQLTVIRFPFAGTRRSAK